MLIGAYRDNEVSSSHPLVGTLETIRKTGANTQEIVLPPLQLDDVAQIVCEALRAEWDRRILWAGWCTRLTSLADEGAWLPRRSSCGFHGSAAG